MFFQSISYAGDYIPAKKSLDGGKRYSMRKTFHSLLTVLLSMIILCTGVLPAFAVDEGISTCMTNCDTTSMSFIVVDGEASFYASYNARAATFTHAKLSVQIQKKFLGLFWKDAADEWVGYSSEIDGFFAETIPVDATGTYRAIFKLQVFGTTATDVIEETIKCTAS